MWHMHRVNAASQSDAATRLHVATPVLAEAVLKHQGRDAKQATKSQVIQASPFVQQKRIVALPSMKYCIILYLF
jgi:hypothetical protein